MREKRQRVITLPLLLTFIATIFAGSAFGDADEKGNAQRNGEPREFHIPSGPLAEAIERFGDQSGLQLIYRQAQVAGKQTPTVSGSFTAEEALDRLLAESDLAWSYVNGITIALRPAAATSPSTEATPTGTIRGTVTLPDAAAAVGTTVTATSPALSGKRTTQTDEDGQYTLTDLPPGRYTLTFELEGMAPVAKEVRVSPEESTTLDVQMSLHEVREDIVVTGSRIRRAEVEGPSPVIFLTREDLDRTGRATVHEALATLPQNFAPPVQNEGFVLIPARVDLRGLGSDNTLVLVNGRRVANSGFGPNGITTFVDLNSIPLAAVERIEVLTDGASAVYGSDAVAGVVNIILKEDFRGTEVSVNYGASSEGGASERQVSFSTGGARAGLRGLLTGEYFDRRRLAGIDRAFSRSNDQTARGGRDLRSTFSSPGNVSSLDGQNLPGLDAPAAGIPAGQDGRNLTPADLVATAGQLNLESLNSFTDIIAPTERWGLSGRLDWELGSELTLFAEAGAAHTTNEPEGSPPSLQVIVPASNPFNPFDQDVQVQWLATELPNQRILSETDNLRALLGLEGRLADGWAWETSLAYSRDELDQPGDPFPDFGIVATLLNRTDPATGLNVFGDGPGSNTPAVLEELAQGSRRQAIDGLGDLLGWEGQLDGVVVRWGGRELRSAVGAEYREESMDHTVQNVFPQAPPQVVGRTTGDREVAAGFAEFSLPLFGREHQRPGVRALELQLAGRFESYSDFGDTFNPRLAVRWQPLASLALRASRSTGFRAPALQELFLSVLEIPNVPVVDPRRNNEFALVLLRTGGNSDLEQEESDSWNVGLVWDVPGVRGLSLTVDGYRVEQDEQITTPTFLFTQLSEELEALFPDRIRRAEPTPEDIAAGRPGRLLEVDIRNLNVRQATVRGADLGLNYLQDTAVGRFDLRVHGAYIDSLDVQLTPLAPIEQLAGTTSFGLALVGSPVRFRGNAALFWSRGAWEVGVTERYTGAPRETSSASPTFEQRLDDHFETDLQLSYRFPDVSGPLGGTRLSLGVENVFNEEPPFRDVELGYNGALHSPRQRFSYLTLTKAFGAERQRRATAPDDETAQTLQP